MAFQAELNEGPEPKSSPASQHGDTLSFPPCFRRGDTLRFPSSPELGSGRVPSSSSGSSSDPEIEENRLSGILSAKSTSEREPHSEPSWPLKSKEKAGSLVANRYVLETSIAQGGMGVVWRAYDQQSEQQVAVKLVATHVTIAEEAAARLRAEAELLALVDSPYVARILDAGTTLDGAPYMVTELLEGVTLQQVLEANASIPLCDAVDWICQAARGLADVHQVGLVHDDLKPSNLFLVDSDSAQPGIKLLDFGVARILSEPATSARDEVVGNPCYMAPERITGSSYADHRADIWSLGVVLYELTTGRRPFDGKTLQDVCAAVMAATPSPICDLRPGVSSELDQIVQRCLQPRPEDRYSNARLLFLDLKRALASLSDPASSTSYPILDASGSTSHPILEASGSTSHPILEASGSTSHPILEASGSTSHPGFEGSYDILEGSNYASNASLEAFDATLEGPWFAPNPSTQASRLTAATRVNSPATAHPNELTALGSAASIRAAKLRAIVQAPSLHQVRPKTQRPALVKVPQPGVSDATQPRRRRRPAVIAYTITISFVALVAVVAAVRIMRLGSAPSPERSELERYQPHEGQTPTVQESPNRPADEAAAPPVDRTKIVVPESPAANSSVPPSGKPTTIVLPTTSSDNAPRAKLSQVSVSTVNGSGAWLPRASSKTKTDTGELRGIPLNEVHINRQGDLVDAQGRPLGKPETATATNGAPLAAQARSKTPESTLPSDYAKLHQ